MAENIAEIVRETLAAQQLTLREMAEALEVSHPTIINWRDANTEPGTDFLFGIRSSSDDWRRDFADACLRVKLPELFN